MQETTTTFTSGVQSAWASTAAFLPKLGMFLLVLIVGYFIAKWLGKLTDMVLERLHFDRAVERGGVKRALERTRFDASDVVAKLVFYAVFLLVLQLAFGMFGPNPVSDLISRVILFIPTLIVSLLIVVIASAIAKAVKDILDVALGNLSYGGFLSKLAGVAIVTVGVFAALSHLGIAPAIVNGLFYAILAVIAGSAIIAIGGGGIAPMRSRWERALGRMESEAPKFRSEARKVGEAAGQKAETWVKSAEGATRTTYTPNP